MTSTPPNLPPQLSEATFRTYEPFIAKAVTAWPSETQWHPDAMTDLTGRRLSPHTFIARFRDATVSLKRFRWSTYIDTAKLWSITGQHSCAYGADGTVWFKHRGRRGRPLDMVGEARDRTSEPLPPPTTWRNVTQDEICALAILLDAGRLTGPYILATGGPLSPDFVASIENERNVAIVWDDGQGVTIIT